MTIDYEIIKKLVGVDIGIVNGNTNPLIIMVLRYTTKTGQSASGFQGFAYVLKYEGFLETLREFSRKGIFDNVRYISVPHSNPLFPYLNS